MPNYAVNELYFSTWQVGIPTGIQIIDDSEIYATPSKDVDFVSVAGRNGDLSFDNNRFQNIEIRFRVYADSLEGYYTGIRHFYSVKGYAELRTTAWSNESRPYYRMAQFISATKLETNQYNKGGVFELVFNCKPQLFFDIGDTWVNVSQNDYFENIYSEFECLPLFRVKGEGTVTITAQNAGRDNQAFTVVSGGIVRPYTYIDSEMQDSTSAETGGQNLNSLVTFTNGFPYISPVRAAITYSGFTSVEYKPRYWTL